MEFDAHGTLVLDQDARDGLVGEERYPARGEMRSQIGVGRAAPALVADRRLDRRDSDLALAIVIRIVGKAIFLECLQAILVQLVDALGQLDRQPAIDAVIVVVESVIILLRHENGRRSA